MNDETRKAILAEIEKARAEDDAHHNIGTGYDAMVAAVDAIEKIVKEDKENAGNKR